MATTVSDLSNGDAVFETAATIDDEIHAVELDETDSEAIRDYVQTAVDPDNVIIEVAGEKVPCEPVGALKRTRIVRDMRKHEKAQAGGDAAPDAELDWFNLVLEVGDVLIDHSADRYDRDWWEARSEEQLFSAFGDLGRKSRGGEKAGK